MRLEAIATPARHSTADYPQQNKLAEVHNIIIIFDIFLFRSCYWDSVSSFTAECFQKFSGWITSSAIDRLQLSLPFSGNNQMKSNQIKINN